MHYVQSVCQPNDLLLLFICHSLSWLKSDLDRNQFIAHYQLCSLRRVKQTCAFAFDYTSIPQNVQFGYDWRKDHISRQPFKGSSKSFSLFSEEEQGQCSIRLCSSTRLPPDLWTRYCRSCIWNNKASWMLCKVMGSLSDFGEHILFVYSKYYQRRLYFLFHCWSHSYFY